MIFRTFLHVGCGSKRRDQTTPALAKWKEIRLDIDPLVDPDVTGTMLNMSAVPTGSVNAVYSSHNIEHLYPHEVPQALAEFLRVLDDEGFAVLTCPDLKSVCALVAKDGLIDPVYKSPAGPIAPLDILYGHRGSLARGNLFMAHRSGFTERVLRSTLLQAGFRSVVSIARGRAPYFDLWAIASKSQRTEEQMKDLACEHLPGFSA